MVDLKKGAVLVTWFQTVGVINNSDDPDWIENGVHELCHVAVLGWELDRFGEHLSKKIGNAIKVNFIGTTVTTTWQAWQELQTLATECVVLEMLRYPVDEDILVENAHKSVDYATPKFWLYSVARLRAARTTRRRAERVFGWLEDIWKDQE